MIELPLVTKPDDEIARFYPTRKKAFLSVKKAFLSVKNAFLSANKAFLRVNKAFLSVKKAFLSVIVRRPPAPQRKVV